MNYKKITIGIGEDSKPLRIGNEENRKPFNRNIFEKKKFKTKGKLIHYRELYQYILNKLRLESQHIEIVILRIKMPLSVLIEESFYSSKDKSDIFSELIHRYMDYHYFSEHGDDWYEWAGEEEDS